jgi:tRNA-modifying protein YgfZ
MTDLSSAVLHRLDRFTVIAVTGADARAFLQGQLSFDLDRLTSQRIELASCSSAQGRVQAVLWLIERSDAIALVVPSSTAETTLTRLRKYVLRAKAKLEVSDRLAVFAAPGLSLEQPAQSHVELDGRSYVQWPGPAARVLCVAPADSGMPDSQTSLQWHRDDIAAGLPQIYPQTHEAFVAQMLNLDVLGGISFEKGCYTGQEIIARTHFRGAIKRRMFRFRAAGPPPEPGARIVAGDHHAGDVVDAASTSAGCELLAVVSLSQAHATLNLATSTGATLELLPLPYEL